ncbi:MAG: C25 family cysteine peptidase [Carboxylicivirga sp.]|nr:C25 family cysteine peptidase [Carboxylicivirga sp.]
MRKKITKKILISILGVVLLWNPVLVSAQEVLKKYYEGNTEAIPLGLDEGETRRGYAIITTRDLAMSLTKLRAFAAHKASLGFNVYIVTEEDFGGGQGETAAYNIRRWLQGNYQELGLIYTLMIGNPTPSCGDIPMMVAMLPTKATATEQVPTDYYFADIDGNWDLNNNGLVGERADFGEDGLNGVWEVLVGRIYYYGEDDNWLGVANNWSKKEDVDEILQRSIDYDNEQDIEWRYNFFAYDVDKMDGGSRSEIVGKFLEPNGINYIHSAEINVFAGLSKPDYIREQGHSNTTILQENDFGYMKWQSHGTTSATWGLNSNAVAANLNPARPTFINFAGCWTANVDRANNIAGATLRYYAIGAGSNTMGVTGYSAPGTKIPELEPHNNNFTIKFLEGKSAGYVHYEFYADIARYASNTVGNTMLKHNYYGDPSIVIFRNGINVPSSVVVSPVKYTYFIKEMDEPRDQAQVFTVWSNIEGHQLAGDVTTDVDWLTITNLGATTTDKAGGIDIKVETNANVDALPAGENTATLTFTGSDGKITKREFTLNINTPKQLAHYSFDGDNVLKNQMNTSLGRISVSNTTDNAVINNIITSSTGLPGKIGNGLLLDRNISTLGFACNYLPTNNIGSSTHTFWIKHGEVLPFGGQVFTVNKGVLSFGVSDSKYYVSVKEADHMWCEGILPEETKILLSESTIQANTWVHVAIIIDRTQDKLRLVLNGVEDASMDLLHRGSIYSPNKHGYSAYQINAIDGAIDELACYNYPLSLAEIGYEMQGVRVSPVYPQDKSNLFVQNDVNFQWTNVESAASYNFYYGNDYDDLILTNPVTSASITGLVTSNANVAALESDMQYYWRVDIVMDNGDIIKGNIFSCYTPNVLWHQESINTTLSTPYDIKISDNMVYDKIRFQGEYYTDGGRKSPFRIYIYTKDELGNDIQMLDINGVDYLRRNCGKSSNGRVFGSPGDGLIEFEILPEFMNKPIWARFYAERTEGFDFTNPCFYAPKTKEALPIFVDEEKVIADVRVGHMEDLSFDVSQLASEPEQVVTYELIGDVQDWVMLEDKMLMGFRQPTEACSCIVTVKATDVNGETDTIDILFNVVE